MELAQRGNQYLKGKSEAFGGFRDMLAEEIKAVMPELGGAVDTVVTGEVARREEGRGENGEAVGMEGKT